MEPKDRIIVALKYRTLQAACGMVDVMTPHVGPIFRLGPGPFIRWGREIMAHLQALGLQMFLDLKSNDDKDEVADACMAATEFGCSMLSVHCDSGLDVMVAAKQAVDEAIRNPLMRQNSLRPWLLGCVMVASKQPVDLEREGVLRLNADAPARAYGEVIDEIVMRRALLAQEAGLDGVIVSPRYVVHVRKACRPDFIIVAPAIYSVGAVVQAVRDGADYLSISRLFRETKDPVGMARRITEAIAVVENEKQV